MNGGDRVLIEEGAWMCDNFRSGHLWFKSFDAIRGNLTSLDYLWIIEGERLTGKMDSRRAYRVILDSGHVMFVAPLNKVHLSSQLDERTEEILE